MFGSPYVATAVRFVIYSALQILVLSRIGIGEVWSRYTLPLLYPLVIILLPVGMPTVVVLILAFALGMTIDVSLGTYGIHTSALLLMAFVRSLVLTLVEPREGYAVGQSPTPNQFGMRWFAGYASILMVVHIFTYFAVETFTFVYIIDILLRTIGSFIVSMVLLLLIVLIRNPRS